MARDPHTPDQISIRFQLRFCSTSWGGRQWNTHSAGLFVVQEDLEKSRLALDSLISGGGVTSIGQRQILALARATVCKSKLFILDDGKFVTSP